MATPSIIEENDTILTALEKAEWSYDESTDGGQTSVGVFLIGSRYPESGRNFPQLPKLGDPHPRIPELYCRIRRFRQVQGAQNLAPSPGAAHHALCEVTVEYVEPRFVPLPPTPRFGGYPLIGFATRPTGQKVETDVITRRQIGFPYYFQRNPDNTISVAVDSQTGERVLNPDGAIGLNVLIPQTSIEVRMPPRLVEPPTAVWMDIAGHCNQGPFTFGVRPVARPGGYTFADGYLLYEGFSQEDLEGGYYGIIHAFRYAWSEKPTANPVYFDDGASVPTPFTLANIPQRYSLTTRFLRTEIPRSEGLPPLPKIDVLDHWISNAYPVRSFQPLGIP